MGGEGVSCKFCETVRFHKNLNKGKSAYFELTLTLRTPDSWVNLGNCKPDYCPVCGKRLWRKGARE